MSNKKKHKQTFLIWLAIYPLITLLFFLFGDLIFKLPVPLRALALTLVAVPIMSYVILPFYYKVFDKWLNHDKNQ